MVLLVVESQLDAAMSANEKAYFKAMGRRIAARRNELGLTQVQMAAELRIPQQTYGSYEVGRHAFPLALLPKLARLLQTDIGSLLGETEKPKPQAKRGPAPKFQQHIERISSLPKTQQRIVIQVLESLLAQQGA
jgi:transcriptional regulator with XRE-family HTH domain